MTISLQQAWREHVATLSHRSSATFTETGLLLGADTVLAAFDTTLGKAGAGSGLAPNAHDRLVCLLAVAGRGQVGEATLLQIGQAVDDWRKGEKALAAIRLAFAKLPRVHDADDSYRLFLAEKALNAGLRPHELLEELGYATALRLLLKYPGQPRNPVGQPTGGQYANGRSGDTASAAIVPVFLDTRHKQEEPATLPDPMHLSHPCNRACRNSISRRPPARRCPFFSSRRRSSRTSGKRRGRVVRRRPRIAVTDRIRTPRPGSGLSTAW